MSLVVTSGVLVAFCYGSSDLYTVIEKAGEAEERNQLMVEEEVEEVTYFYVVLFFLCFDFGFSVLNKSPYSDDCLWEIGIFVPL